jgi:AraC family transcriptional regulator
MEVRIESVPVMRVAFMRHNGPYRQVGQTWGRLCAWAGPRGLVGPRTVMLGVAHDDPQVTPPEKLRYDACLTVDGRFKPEGDVGVQEVGGGEYAVTTHRGPYDTIGQTVTRLCGEWLPASGREPRPVPMFEIYRNSPQDTAPENLLTDLYLPLAAR